MRIVYLLESTSLCGGVKVIFDQAVALAQLGHKVKIRSVKGDHNWYEYPVDVEYVDSLDAPLDPGFRPDALICTYWTTVSPALSLDIPVTVHLCQGYEADMPELEQIHENIREAYRIRIPKFTIGEWMSDHLLEVFGPHAFPVFTIGQVVDTRLFRPEKKSLWRCIVSFTGRRTMHRVLIVGDHFISCKGVADALQAVSLLRRAGENIYLIRVSLFPISDEERLITQVDESHVMIPPREMASVYQKSDLLLAASLPGEGFGLPFAEALASGVPAVATEISPYLSLDGRPDYALFVKVHDPQGIADAACSILHKRSLYKRLQLRGRRLVRKRFSPDGVARSMEAALTELLYNSENQQGKVMN